MGQSYSDACTCKCAPVPSANGRFNCVFFFGIFHIVVELVFCFILFILLTVDALIGAFVFLASFLSLIGASMAICCCPNYVGWASNVTLHSIALFIRLVVFGSIIGLLVQGTQKSGIYAVDCVCIIMASFSGIPFWCLARNALKSMRVASDNNEIDIVNNLDIADRGGVELTRPTRNQPVATVAEYANVINSHQKTDFDPHPTAIVISDIPQNQSEKQSDSRHNLMMSAATRTNNNKQQSNSVDRLYAVEEKKTNGGSHIPIAVASPITNSYPTSVTTPSTSTYSSNQISRNGNGNHSSLNSAQPLARYNYPIVYSGNIIHLNADDTSPV